MKSSNTVTAVTVLTAAAELEAGELVLLGREPWMSARYGFVSIKGQPPSQAAGQLRDLVAEAKRQSPARRRGFAPASDCARQGDAAAAPGPHGRFAGEEDDAGAFPR